MKPPEKFFSLAVLSMGAASLVLGVVFLAYGALITQIHYRIFFTDDYSSLENQGRILSPRKNPLFRMMLLAVFCAICFVGRSIVLILSTSIGFNVQDTVWFSAMYFSLCEILPSAVMLQLFVVSRNPSSNRDRTSGAKREPFLQEDEAVTIESPVETGISHNRTPQAKNPRTILASPPAKECGGSGLLTPDAGMRIPISSSSAEKANKYIFSHECKWVDQNARPKCEKKILRRIWSH
eukprot:CAMPEP_0167754698 /NCGR_PEP_ID=MMETSP0110_2-20121227/8416_1 /TAXON_ID=629695 /ORGANISM="Gymnochlora sp., Strain CCMP2014" /LENGTH=236 /DNA_ID=CAMNT_0007640609 /DNA_START=496 /DNA_END=1205 /DNA_ORIENTATION=+